MGRALGFSNPMIWMFGGSFWAWRVCGPWAGFWRCCCPGGWGGVKSRLVGRFRAFWPHPGGPVLMPRAACSEAVRLSCLLHLVKQAVG